MAEPSSSEEFAAAYSQGDFVRVVGAADYNDAEGEVAWVDHEVQKLGVWIDDDEPRMPVTFLYSEVRRV